MESSTAQSINTENSTSTNGLQVAIKSDLTEENYLEIGAFSITALLSLAGNLLVAVVYAKNKSGRLRSMNNLLLINLSLAVILHTCNFYPMVVYGIVKGYMHWGISGVISLIVCKIELVLLNGLFLVCQLSVLAVAIERFLIVCFPLKLLVTPRVIHLLIASCWIIALALYSPLLYLGKLVQANGLQRCIASYNPHIALPWFKVETAVLIAVNCTLLAAYLGILCRIYTRRLPGHALQEQVRRSSRINRKVTVRVTMILVLFYFSWVPFCLVNVFYFSNDIDILENPVYSFLVQFMPFLYGALCPWVFPLLHEDFRQGMVALLCAHRRRRRSMGPLHLNSMVQNSVAGSHSTVTTLSITQ